MDLRPNEAWGWLGFFMSVVGFLSGMVLIATVDPVLFLAAACLVGSQWGHEILTWVMDDQGRKEKIRYANPSVPDRKD